MYDFDRVEFNWQTLVIQDAESDIKALLKNSIIIKSPWNIVKEKVDKIIEKAQEQLESQTLIDECVNTLERFAYLQYSSLASRLERMTLNTALIAVTTLLATKSIFTKQEAVKISKIIDKTPVLKFNNLGADNIALRTDGYYEIGQPLQTYSKFYHTQVENAFTQLAKSNAQARYDSKVSLRNISEMIVRNERNLKELEDLEGRGVQLVWTSTHANCSKRCEPWQGRLYSLDGTSGVKDGHRYIPLETAMNQYYTTHAGKTYKNGIISGFNCRHHLIAYVDSSTVPFHVSAEVIDREREINDNQRYMERKIREYRDLAEAYDGVDNYKHKKYRDLAKAWKSKYVKYSADNEVAYYPVRLEKLDGEYLQENYKGAIKKRAEHIAKDKK